MRNDFVAFILSHGRAGNVDTLKTLRSQGYTGDIVFILDDEDKQRDEYEKRYGADNIEVFSKLEISKRFDEMVKGDRRTIVYARNAAFDIAEKRGYRYFVELDDDYTFFAFCFDENGVPITREKNTNRLDEVFEAMVHFLEETPETVKTIAFSQGGDFIGGVKSDDKKITLKRKAMNSFFCDVKRRFWFIGRINEDVNTYVLQGNRGDLFFTTTFFSLNQKITQKNKGGMSDVYIDSGTYLKSMFSVMALPSAVDCRLMGAKNMRLHHNVKWKNAVPCIINEKYRKL